MSHDRTIWCCGRWLEKGALLNGRVTIFDFMYKGSAMVLSVRDSSSTQYRLYQSSV